MCLTIRGGHLQQHQSVMVVQRRSSVACSTRSAEKWERWRRRRREQLRAPPDPAQPVQVPVSSAAHRDAVAGELPGRLRVVLPAL